MSLRHGWAADGATAWRIGIQWRFNEKSVPVLNHAPKPVGFVIPTTDSSRDAFGLVTADLEKRLGTKRG